MDKNELIEKIAGNTGLTKKDVGIVINTFIVTVTKALVEGSKVQLLGFGDYSGPLAHPGRSLAQLDRASAHSTRSAVQPMLAADQHTC